MSNLLKLTTAKQEREIRNVSKLLNVLKHKDELSFNEVEILEGLMREQELGQLSARQFISNFKQINPVMYKEVEDVVKATENNQDQI